MDDSLKLAQEIQDTCAVAHCLVLICMQTRYLHQIAATLLTLPPPLELLVQVTFLMRSLGISAPKD